MKFLWDLLQSSSGDSWLIMIGNIFYISLSISFISQRQCKEQNEESLQLLFGGFPNLLSTLAYIFVMIGYYVSFRILEFRMEVFVKSNHYLQYPLSNVYRAFTFVLKIKIKNWCNYVIYFQLYLVLTLTQV